MNHVSTYIFICVMLASCGSFSSSSNSTYKEQKNEAGTSASAERMQAKTSDTLTTTQSASTHISEYTRITLYNDSGRISGVQESWRNTRHDELGTSTGRSSTDTVKEKKTEASSAISTGIISETDENSIIDNRPVQGIEWLYIVLSAGVILIVVGIIIYRTIKK